jgi:anthranilate phosphoribosyltransferase
MRAGPDVMIIDSTAPLAAPPEFSDILKRLAEKRDLTRAEAASALEQIVDGTVGEAQAAAFLMGLRVKGETAAEIAGLVDGMRGLVTRVETAEPRLLLDIVGTGGDDLGTFNISTTAAFVAAGAGAKVAKHGNRAASSRCGSADVLEALGVHIGLGPDGVAACIDEVGIGFMLAAIYHPAAGKLAPVRRALGLRTVFNFLGPLTNPASAGRQLMGVSSADYLEVLAGALARGGSEHALLVHGQDGMDEISVTGLTTVVEVIAGRVARPYEIEPETLGLARCGISDLAGGDPAANALITRKVLDGLRGGPRDAVIANAAAALYVVGKAGSIVEGVALAQTSIDSGRAARALDHLVAFSAALSEDGR